MKKLTGSKTEKLVALGGTSERKINYNLRQNNKNRGINKMAYSADWLETAKTEVC